MIQNKGKKDAFKDVIVQYAQWMWFDVFNNIFSKKFLSDYRAETAFY